MVLTELISDNGVDHGERVDPDLLASCGHALSRQINAPAGKSRPGRDNAKSYSLTGHPLLLDWPDPDVDIIGLDQPNAGGIAHSAQDRGVSAGR